MIRLRVYIHCESIYNASSLLCLGIVWCRGANYYDNMKPLRLISIPDTPLSSLAPIRDSPSSMHVGNTGVTYSSSLRSSLRDDHFAYPNRRVALRSLIFVSL
jgi:hypothetical protein